MTSAERGLGSIFTIVPSRAVTEHARRMARSVTQAVGSDRPIAAWALASSVTPPVLMTAAWLIAGWLQRGSYSPMSQTVSVLAGDAGTHRWIVTGALLVVGACYFATAAGLGALPARGRIGLLVAGIAAVGIAACPEPVRGATAQHAAFTVLGALAITVWPALAARRGAPSAVVGVRVSATVTVIFLGLLAWVFAETQSGSTLGIAERLSSSVEIAWPFVVAAALRHSYRERAAPAACRERAALAARSR